jgi:hypothetical protein
MLIPGDSTRGSLDWADVFREFAAIPGLVKRVPPEDRAYATNEMLREPAYLVMEHLLAENTIVYSPPKVGGQTIAATLWAHPAIPQPKHIHFLSPKGLAFMQRLIEQTQGHPNQHMWHTLLLHSRWVRVLLAANRLLRASGLGSLVPKPILIAGVREPMSQYLSMVFQAWWMYVDKPADLSAEFIRARMMADPWRHQCNNWFTDDLRETIGLDVFARPFPTEQGWDIYENEIARVMIIRQENLDRLPQALGTLYGIDPASVALETRNKAEEKDYSTEYATVKRDWRPSERELEEVYAPAYVRHFYTPREVSAFQERWRKRSSSAVQQPAAGKELQEKPVATGEVAATTKNSEPRGEQHTSGTIKVSQHNSWQCRPCSQCAHELQTVPILRQACQERLEIIGRLQSLWPLRLLRKCRQFYRRLFRGTRSIR